MSGIDFNFSETLDVVPNDDDDLPKTFYCLYIGVGGDIKMTTMTGTTSIFKNLPNSCCIRGEIKKVWNIGTTASGIVALI